ncbi:MAG: DM13 domain-containing protein [Burkholderiales bacterium]
MKKVALLTLSHTLALTLGFGLGIYALPILIAPEGPANSELKSLQGEARYRTEFRRDVKGSDLLHWGEGAVSVDAKRVALQGKLSPGPDYKLYLVPRFVDTKEEFLKVKTTALRVGDIKTFENFVVDLPPNTDIDKFNTVLVWCETFSMFISAAKYR